MEIELPKRIAEDGAEYHIDKINNTCRLTVLGILKKKLEDEYKDVLKDPVFGPILAINEHELGYSGKVIHSFVCKMLDISKRHELCKCEAEKNIDFESWRNDKGFWGTLLKRNGEVDMRTIRLTLITECKDWSRVDRVRLVYLCVICFVMAKDEKVNIPHEYIRLVMDFDKMRKYPWGLHAYDMLLESIKNARYKLKKNSYVLDGFSYALQIWLMEAIPDIGTLLGQKYKEGITSVRCRNWYGNGKVSYHDITTLETALGQRAVVFPFISETGNNDAVYNTFVWQVEEDIRTEDQLDVKVNVAVEGTQDQLDGKDKVAVENEVPVTEKEEPVEPVAKRRVTKKTKDPGCESRKRLLLCQRASEKNTGLSDETKTFITGLFNTSFNSMKQEVQKHVDHRFDKLDSEIAQLKQTVTALANTRNLAPASETPQPSPMPSPRPQRKDEKLDDVEMHDFHGNLHNVTVSQSSNIDLEMGTQDYLWKTMGNLTQDSYVKGFDPSQKAKVDDPMEWELQIGPSLFTKEMSARIVGPTEWLKNFKVTRNFQEIDAMLFLFRERTTLGRWKANKVAFMSCIFSNQIKCSYSTFKKDRNKFKVEGLLLDYGTGQLPPHGRTGLVWDVDVSRMYVPVFVHGNHWIALCVNFVTQTIEVFDSVQSAENQKHLNIRAYKVVYVPMPFINKSNSDCGIYALKFIECHALGLDLTLVNDDNIREARHKIAYDLWEAANDPELMLRMSKYSPPKTVTSNVVVLP
ncbi:hypothetical protein Bca4012_025234 [Brassica carinata]